MMTSDFPVGLDKDAFAKALAAGLAAYREAMGGVAAPVAVADAEGWIEHDGKGMPVDSGTIVNCKFRDGDECGGYRAGFWHESNSWWVHRGDPDDIVAYRVLP